MKWLKRKIQQWLETSPKTINVHYQGVADRETARQISERVSRQQARAAYRCQ